jgi:predicted phosphate transport protein (TIGR00153 family)
MFGSKKKDAAFFDAFTAHAAQSVAASKMLVEMFTQLALPSGPTSAYQADGDAAATGDLDSAKTLATRIKAAETAGDTITHETVKRLHENWITPLDRNDIHGLISRMDDVLDFIEAAAERVVLFQVRRAPPESVDLCNVLVESCESLAMAIALLPSMANSRKILELCVEVNRLENKADAIYRGAIAELFKPGHDPLMVMKWRDIFDSLESASDRCEDVANVIEGVVLEYA